MIRTDKHFLAPGIILLRSALPQTICKQIVDAIESRNAWIPARTGIYENGNLVDIDVYGSTHGVAVTQWQDTESTWLAELSTLITELARENWSIPVTGFSKIAISKYENSAGIETHTDSGVYNTNRILTIVVYLNEEFTGGKLLFPNHGIDLPPHQGDIVVFFSEYAHSVTSVSQGRRYAMVFFAENNAVTNYKLHLH